MICRVCRAAAVLRFASHPGYAIDTAYDIYECNGCGASFASPLLISDGIYQHIYEHAAAISGYDRYVRYAALVREASDPRALLAGREDVYYAIDVMVRRIERSRPKLLEIGSGLGSLTYALARSGCEIEGWDISPSAVREAIARFGPYFHVRDVFAPVADDANRFDAIIMTEVIEHVADPPAFLTAVCRFLVPGGRFLITTPNKSFFEPSPVWHTDPPPVHLWWFSERSVQILGERLKMDVRMLDFSQYNDWHRPQPQHVASLTAPTRESILTADGSPINGAPPPEPWRLFPLSQSVVPIVVGAVRSAARTLGVALDRSSAANRRPTCAFELVSV